jgi:hypothetical protein
MESSKVNISITTNNETSITSNQSNPVENKVILAEHKNIFSVANNSNTTRFIEILNTKDVVKIFVELIMKSRDKHHDQNKIKTI